MALTLPYSFPAVQVPAAFGSPNIDGKPAGSHINQYDIVKLVTGNYVPAAPGDTTNLVGIATADSNETFFDAAPTAKSVFGTFQFDAAGVSGLFPNNPAFLLAECFFPFFIVEMTLSQSYAWIPGSNAALTAGPGTRVGINVVGGTGGIGTFTGNTNFYYADPAQSACATIESLVARPVNTQNYQSPAVTANQPPVGSFGVRVLVRFDAAACVIAGH